MSEPFYQEFPADQIPEETHEDGGLLRVIAGTTAAGTEGPVRGIPTAPLYLDAILPAGAELDQPIDPAANAFLYIYEGAVDIEGPVGPHPVGKGHLAALSDGDHVHLIAGPDGARLILLSALPINEPVACHGPFVMNTREEIMQAFEDMRAGRF
jgi:redox-sensitive bicupin YhaK (pirin superfamily)